MAEGIPPEYWDAPPEPYEGAFFDAFMGAVMEASPKDVEQVPDPDAQVGKSQETDADDAAHA